MILQNQEVLFYILFSLRDRLHLNVDIEVSNSNGSILMLQALQYLYNSSSSVVELWW